MQCASRTAMCIRCNFYDCFSDSLFSDPWEPSRHEWPSPTRGCRHVLHKTLCHKRIQHATMSRKTLVALQAPLSCPWLPRLESERLFFGLDGTMAALKCLYSMQTRRGRKEKRRKPFPEEFLVWSFGPCSFWSSSVSLVLIPTLGCLFRPLERYTAAMCHHLLR